ncbi:MAG: thiamine pyrophosphate-binding protein [Candidatus Tectomicrobia bacterium]|uniref:Thiamine pyrophosphate-binding protein n=1 Tax=Tectimicrobiota bacterium TaxID=2528274 RepID=A0A937W196_UNCTE|nr:thiamine pyrophosphate-binding protein [Candidatus Tectomicrobia bacterium]
MVTYADVVAKLLADAQIEYIFGMPGSRASVELIEAARKQGIEYVLSNNEAAAAVMAATYGVLQRRPGVCSVGVGPGATNVVNGVAHALLERAPMLMFTDRYPDDLYRHLPRQRVDQEQLFRPITKGTFPIADDSTARSMQRALHLAMDGRPGPVHLDLPDDVMQHEAAGLPEPTPAQTWHGAVSTDHPAVQSLAATIGQARRPIVIAGLGVNRSGSEAALQALTEALQAPVLCAVSAKGTIADDHPWCGGTFMGSEASHGLIAQSDLIITIGLDVVELFEPGLWPYDQRVLNLDNVPHQDGLFHPSQELVGDIGASLHALTPLLKPCGGWQTADLAAFRARQRPPLTTSGVRLSPAAALRIMRQVLPRETILTTDAGQHKVYASRLWECYQPLDYLTSSGLGTMGVAIPIAIATKLVRRERPVVALTGDGGFLMRVSELETARRAGTPIIVVIFNDGYLNLIKIKQDRQGYAVLGSQFAPVDFAQVSAGFGFRAVRAETEAVLQDALQQAVASGEPWVIDAIIDPEGYV